MSLMIFIFLCFLGLSIMFFFILRGQEKIHGALREELAMVRAHMQQIEAKISGEPMVEQTNMQALRPAALHSAQSQTSPQAQTLPQTDTLNREDQSHEPDKFDRFDPPESLSMDAPSASKAPSGGLDLHFDPQQNFRR